VVEIVFIHQGEIAIIGRGIGFWRISENPADIAPDKKGAAGDDRALVPDPHGEPVNVMMADLTDNKDTGRGIPHHLPVQAPGDPVDLKELECDVFRTEFTGPLNGKFELLFLL